MAHMKSSMALKKGHMALMKGTMALAKGNKALRHVNPLSAGDAFKRIHTVFPQLKFDRN